jgi:tRNA A-37 threonylcarbamoyl transferase component Bud32
MPEGGGREGEGTASMHPRPHVWRYTLAKPMIRTCPICGALSPVGASICPVCGPPTPTDVSTPPHGFSAAVFPPLEGYRSAGVLGQGGMGVVYLADDVILRRTVAVKVISENRGDSPVDRGRFLREARSMAAIEHPNVVRVYSFGESLRQPYIVMEYVRGESLAARLRRGPLPLREACRIVREVALGLNAAWARRVVHRDVKPSNVLLDSQGRAHVADFGLAESADPADSVAGVPPAGVVGTPQYMAPEQARGLTTDFRADIYALGILFYELLNGRRPFEGTTHSGLRRQHLEEPLPPMKPEHADVPEAVQKLLVWMTRKDPAMRPRSYRELVEALDAAVPPDPAVLSVPQWWAMSDLVASLRRGHGWSLALAWGTVTVLCTVTGVLNITHDWNAIPVSLGPVTLDLTFYPAFPASLLCAVWLGPGWGAVPVYLANLAGAVYGGVPFPINFLFAAAGSIEVLILWGLFVALDIDPDLRRARDVVRFVGSAAVAAVIASTSVIVWNASRGNDFSTGQRLWYAWVAGDIVQAALVVAPMRWLGSPARRWIRGQMAREPRSEITYTRVAVTLAVVLAALGISIFAGFELVQESLERDLVTAGGRTELRLRLFEMQLFVGILIVALVVATGVVSTTLARKGIVEGRRREDL